MPSSFEDASKTSSSFEDSDQEVSETKKRCNWCNKKKKLFQNKPYCLECKIAAVGICSRCHRCFDDQKYFTLSKLRCNACERKRIAEQDKRKQKKLLKEASNSSNNKEIDITEKPTETCDIILKNRKIGYIPIYF